jgi:hypothetical protein
MLSSGACDAESDVGERLNDWVEAGLSGARWDRLIVAAGHFARLPVVMGRLLASVLPNLLVEPTLAKLSFTVELAHRGLFLPA